MQKRKVKLLSTLIMMIISIVAMGFGVYSAANVTYAVNNKISYATNLAIKITANAKAYNAISSINTTYASTSSLPAIGDLSIIYKVGSSYYIYCNSALDYDANNVIKDSTTGAGYKLITAYTSLPASGTTGDFCINTTTNKTFVWNGSSFVQTPYRKNSFRYVFNDSESLAVIPTFAWDGSLTANETIDQTIGNNLYFDNSITAYGKDAQNKNNSLKIVFTFEFKNLASIRTVRVIYPINYASGQIIRTCSLSSGSVSTSGLNNYFTVNSGSTVTATFTYMLNYVTHSSSTLDHKLDFTINDDNA